MSALDKIVALSQGAPVPVYREADPAAELVTAALSAVKELRVLLASPPDKEDEDKGKDGGSTDQGGKGGDGGGHASHPLFKKLLAKKVDPKRAANMCTQADKRIKAAALTEAAVIALSGLTAASGDWVEATSGPGEAVLLAGGKKPYGNVSYADPGHQKDGKARYPTDTPEHTRAAWSYVNQKENAGKYTPEDLAKVKGKIKGAMKKHGIKGGDDGDKVEASYVVELDEVALAGKPPFGKGKGGKGKPSFPPQNMHHGSFTGAHSHGHPVQSVHEHEHFHNNDSSHDFHAHNGDDSGQDNGYSRDRDW